MRGFASILTRAGTGSVIADRTREIGYARCSDLIGKIGREIERGAAKPGEAVALECEQSLGSALVLLHLLDREGSVILMRPADKERPDRPVPPRFCRSLVRAGPLDENTGIELEVEQNPDWEPANDARAGAYLFVQTSGTTGEPKLVAHEPARLLRNAGNCVERLGIAGNDRVAIPVPIHHLFGLGAAFLPALIAGASIDLQPRSNLLRFLQRDREFAPNVVFLTPPFLETLIRGMKSPRDYDLTVVAGDRLNEKSFHRWEKTCGPIVQLYGSSELGAIAAASPRDGTRIRAGSVGRPMPGVECRIADDQPRGELLCRHPDSFAGYADDNGTVADREPGSWHATHDLAEWDDRGCLRILGRNDHRVNRDGILVALGGIERAMETIPGIESAVVVAAGESARGKGIAAFCTLAEGTDAGREAIRDACFGLLPRSQVPDMVELVDTLPKLPSGKPDRAALVRLAEETRSCPDQSP